MNAQLTFFPFDVVWHRCPPASCLCPECDGNGFAYPEEWGECSTCNNVAYPSCVLCEDGSDPATGYLEWLDGSREWYHSDCVRKDGYGN